MRYQFYTYGISDYSCFFVMPYVGIDNQNEELDIRIIQAINQIAFDGEKEESALPLRGLGGTTCSNENARYFGSATTLLYSVGWSHWCYLWGRKPAKYEDGSIIIKKNLQLLKKYQDRLSGIYGYIEKENLLNKRYDVVIMTEVLKHFRINPIEMMKKISDALVDNGRIG